MTWSRVFESAAALVVGALFLGIARLLGRFWRAARSFRRLPPGIQVLVETDPEVLIRVMGDDAYGTISFQFQLAAERVGDISTPPSDGLLAWSRWAKTNGGTPVGWSVVLVTIQVIDDLAVVVEPPTITHRCSALPSGVQVSPEGMGGGPVTTRVYHVMLDGSQSRVEPQDATRSFSIARNETERLLLQTEVGYGWYEWTAVLPVVVNGRRVLHPLSSKPFHTAGEDHGRLHVWDPDNAKWVPPPTPGQE